MSTSVTSYQVPPINLNELINTKYQEAVANGDVIFTKTESKTLKNSEKGQKYWVTYAPSLNSKPEREDFEKIKKETKQETNPFLKEEPELSVLSTLNDDYKLVLNKFPIIPNHLLLVTKEYKSQSTPLTPKDLYTSYKLLQVLDVTKSGDSDDSDSDSEDDNDGINATKPKRHVVFYNCGENSGSSVDHKHLQILELPEKLKMYQDKLVSKNPEPFIPNMMKEPLQDDKVGFSHFVIPLPGAEEGDDEEKEVVDEDYLAMCFASLLQRTLSFFQNRNFQEGQENSKILPISYNFMMTQKWMCLVPRKAAYGEIEVPISEDEETNKHSLRLGINSTGYLNMILVKDSESKHKLHSNPKLVDEILTLCSFPNSSSYKPDEYDY